MIGGKYLREREKKAWQKGQAMRVLQLELIGKNRPSAGPVVGSSAIKCTSIGSTG
jgi:hypothetical protein